MSNYGHDLSTVTLPATPHAHVGHAYNSEHRHDEGDDQFDEDGDIEQCYDDEDDAQRMDETEYHD